MMLDKRYDQKMITIDMIKKVDMLRIKKRKINMLKTFKNIKSWSHLGGAW